MNNKNDKIAKMAADAANPAPDQITLLPVKNDYVFSRLFGAKNHKRVLISLLNAILNGNPHIRDLTLEPTEYRKKMPRGKSARLDIVATSDSGAITNIEMQCVSQENIIDRMDFYEAIMREETLKEGQNYSEVPDIIAIWIVDEIVTDRNGCLHEIVNMYKDNGIDPVEIASSKTRGIIIELPKLESAPMNFYNGMFSVWMNFVKHPEAIPPELLEITEVKEAMDELKIMSMDMATRLEYIARLKQINDARALRRSGFKEGEEAGLKKGEKLGLKKGEEIGIKRGEELGFKKIAKAMLEHGDDENYIAQITGLSIEEIHKLKG